MRTLFVGILCLIAVGCGPRADERHYTLHGQVVSLANDRKQATISHEPITGFMPAMTMPYTVRDARQFDGIAAGDLINATLVVVSNDAYLTGISKVGQAPLPPAQAGTPTPSASSGFELLKPGEEVPDAPFVDQDGRKRTFHSFKGSTVLMTFIYTKCPMPTFCPLMDRHFATIEKRMKADAALQGRVHLVSVSFDPIVDTPPVLKAHARTLGADLREWTFLTGNRDDIDRFSARFGVSVARAENDQRDITHNLRTAIVDSDGRLVKVYIGNEWTPEQVLTDLAPVVHARAAS